MYKGMECFSRDRKTIQKSDKNATVEKTKNSSDEPKTNGLKGEQISELGNQQNISKQKQKGKKSGEKKTVL